MISLFANWRLIIGVGLAVALGCALWWASNQSNRADTLEAETRILKAELIAAERRSDALARAAAERAADTQELANRDKEITDAIEKAAVPGTAPGPAAVALGCERLRRQGSTASAEYRRLCGGR